MPEFRYEVINIKGKPEKGKLSANSKLEALQILSSRDLLSARSNSHRLHAIIRRPLYFPLLRRKSVSSLDSLQRWFLPVLG